MWMVEIPSKFGKSGYVGMVDPMAPMALFVVKLDLPGWRHLSHFWGLDHDACGTLSQWQGLKLHSSWNSAARLGWNEDESKFLLSCYEISEHLSRFKLEVGLSSTAGQVLTKANQKYCNHNIHQLIYCNIILYTVEIFRIVKIMVSVYVLYR